MTNYHRLPDDYDNTRRLFYGYIEHGMPLPDVLMHIVRNDLYRAVTSWDSKALDFFHTVVLWLYTEAPAHAIGNPENVRLWIERGGRQGILKAAEDAKAHLRHRPHPYVRALPVILEPMD